MPIFMDRHDVSETVTAENVAWLHQQDLKIQDQFGCKGLTYWFDETRKAAFCLVEAPDADAIWRMHNHAHGEVPTQIIEVEPGIVESFLGRIQDPEGPETGLNIIRESPFRIVMLLLLRQLAPVKNDTGLFQLQLKKFHDAVLNLLNAQAGKPVKQTESSWIVSFQSVSHAIQSAMDIRLLFQALKKDTGNALSLKIGLSAGIPVEKNKSLFEDSIKLAERMCNALQGEILISPEVKELYYNENSEKLDKEDHIFALTRPDEKFFTLLMDYAESVRSDIGLKVADFCKQVGCSKSQFYRKMIALTGQSPNLFIRELRLNEALHLLREKSGNISEIAYQTGFTSPSYFSKCFLKKYGYSPSAYLHSSPQH